ncbi:YitT family protein [Planococcus halotolerans]|uniref:YitT family protein n=2 Tax=Planococcus halotolerans TaxID=2233542 RepID=A0A365L6U2_9BACL|nr:YitT family protein [Planococcus halotolerans]RAZ80851.1 YitT family protein [Planococcus halotolerans]
MMRTLFYRWLFFLSGLIILALGFTMIIKANKLGIGPWDVLHVGLFMNFGLTIGTWSILVAFILIIISTISQRRLPQIGTFLNMILIGVFIDIYYFLIPDIPSITGQVLILIGGIIVSGFGVGIYVAPKIGAGPRDSLMLVLMQKTGLSVTVVRAGIEITAALIGWALGGPVGIGTIAVALLTGRIVQYTLPQAEALLKKIIEKKDEVPPVLKV